MVSVNGPYSSRPSQIQLGSQSTNRTNLTIPDENRNGQAQSISNGVRSENPSRQPSGKQIPFRPRGALQSINGDDDSTNLDGGSGANGQEEDTQSDWQMRHGWDDQYSSEEYLSDLSTVSQTRPHQGMLPTSQQS